MLEDKINLKIGDVVVVNPGIKDPDVNIDIGGWQGRVSEIDEEDKVVGIDWDSITLKSMPDSIFKKCKEMDLDWRQIYLELNEVELTTVRDTKTDVVETIRTLEIKHGESHSNKRSEFASKDIGKSFDIRAGAYIIDVIGIGILHLIAGYTLVFAFEAILLVIAGLAGRKFVMAETDVLSSTFFDLVVPHILYFTLFEWLYGATLGKVLLHMRVVNRDGKPCGLGQAFFRGLLRLIDGFPVGLIAYKNMKPPLYQRLGDKLVGTIVVGSENPIIEKRRTGWTLFMVIMVYLLLSGIIQVLSELINLRIL